MAAARLFVINVKQQQKKIFNYIEKILLSHWNMCRCKMRRKNNKLLNVLSEAERCKTQHARIILSMNTICLTGFPGRYL